MHQEKFYYVTILCCICAVIAAPTTAVTEDVPATTNLPFDTRENEIDGKVSRDDETPPTTIENEVFPSTTIATEASTFNELSTTDDSDGMSPTEVAMSEKIGEKIITDEIASIGKRIEDEIMDESTLKPLEIATLGEISATTLKTPVTNALPFIPQQYIPMLQKIVSNFINSENFLTTTEPAVTTTALPSTTASPDFIKMRVIQHYKEILRAHVLRALFAMLGELKRRQVESEQQHQHAHESRIIEAKALHHRSSNTNSECGDENDDVSTNDNGKVIVYDKNVQGYVYIDKKDLLEQTSHVKMVREGREIYFATF